MSVFGIFTIVYLESSHSFRMCCSDFLNSIMTHKLRRISNIISGYLLKIWEVRHTNMCKSISIVTAICWLHHSSQLHSLPALHYKCRLQWEWLYAMLVLFAINSQWCCRHHRLTRSLPLSGTPNVGYNYNDNALSWCSLNTRFVILGDWKPPQIIFTFRTALKFVL